VRKAVELFLVPRDGFNSVMSSSFSPGQKRKPKGVNPSKSKAGHVDGPFRERFGRLKHRGRGLQIDSRLVEGTNKAQLEQWITDYGEDSDFVRISVAREIPRAWQLPLISHENVAIPDTPTPRGLVARDHGLRCGAVGGDQTVVGIWEGRKIPHSRQVSRPRYCADS